MNFLKSAFVVSFFTLISRCFGFFRDICFAKYLGTGFFSDVFLTAFRLPNFFRNIFAEGAFNSAFVPIFSSSLVKHNDKEIKRFSNNIFSILLYFLLIFTLLIEIAMPFVIRGIAPGFLSDPEKYSLGVTLSRITFPYLIFISLTSFLAGILNSLNKFACVAIYPVILNICFITFSILSAFISINITYILSVAVLVGGLFQFLWLFFFSVKNKMVLYPVYPTFDRKTKLFFKQFANSFIGSGVMQINAMVDSIVATLIPGAVSYIYYGDRISQLPLALIGTAISISILPALSQSIELKNEKESHEMQESGMFIALFLGLPSMVGLFLLAPTMIPLLFERGAFTASDSLHVIKTVQLYSLTLPLSIIIKILQTVCYANKDTATPLKVAIVALIINVVLDVALIHPFSYFGIIIATAVSLIVSLYLFISKLKKDKKIRFSKLFMTNCFKIVYILIFTALAIIIMNKYLLAHTTSIFLKFVKLFLTIGIAGIIYLGLAYITDIINKPMLDNLLKK